MSRSSLHDAAAVASALCKIAKGIVISPGATAAASNRGPPRPWPTQTNLRAEVQDSAKRPVDGTVPEVKVKAQSLLKPEGSSSVFPTKETRPWPSKTPTLLPRRPLSAVENVLKTSVSQVADPVHQAEAIIVTDTPKAELDPANQAEAIIVTDTLKAEPASAELRTVQSTETDPVERSNTANIPKAIKPAAESESSPSISSATSKSDFNGTQTSTVVITAPSNGPGGSASEAFGDVEEYDAVQESKKVPLKAAKVPSSRLGRLLHYGGLGAGLAFGAAGSFFRGPSTGSQGENPSLFMSEQNVSRLVDKLSTMRGAALKLGQFLSIQETKLLPPQIEQVLLRVQNSANYMPVWQMNKVMAQELGGADWKDRYFKDFDEIPFASASIGQVHSAVLRDDFPDADVAGRRVAVKVQFPGVYDSIDSDLSYLRWLVSASALLPKGLFLENTLRVLGQELKDECNYLREAEMGRRFREVLRNSSEFEVPKVVDSLCTDKVLTTEMMRGRPLSMASRYPQETRNRIAESILNLSLSELFRYRLMQTDPNWSNFLYNEKDGKIQLIDFGATREYSKGFMDNWLKMLQAAIRGDHDECVAWSRRVGYLTGQESQEMEHAHVQSMIALGEPFRHDAPDPYPFESQTITDRVKAQIPLMLRERLTPPPQETYSLNRKLSGAFLLCARLKAHISCRKLFEQIEADYEFGPEPKDAPAASEIGISASGPFSSSQQRRHFHAAFARQEISAGPRRHGINLADRFPRAKVILRGDEFEKGDASSDKVESLGSLPTAVPSIIETPEMSKDGSVPYVDLERKMLPAEITSEKAESPELARDENAASPVPNVLGPTRIRGIVIPLKPPPPGPEECCMSGCAHCTYDIYAEDLEDFHTRLSLVRRQLMQLQPPVSKDEWRQDLLGDYPTESSQAGGEDMREKAQQEVDRVIGDLDPSMKAFLEMERRIKKQEREKTKQNSQLA